MRGPEKSMGPWWVEESPDQGPMGMGPWGPEKSPEGDHMAGPKLVPSNPPVIPSKEGIGPEASPLNEAGIIIGPSKKPVLSAVEGSKLVMPSGILLLMAPESWVMGAMAEVDVGENEAMGVLKELEYA